MLAERIKEWIQDGQQEGFEKGIQQGRKEGVERGREKGREEGREEGREDERQQSIAALRAMLFQKLAERVSFPTSETTRRRVEAISSVVDLAELIARVPLAASLSDLGLE